MGAGRPKLWNTPDELQKEIDKYFSAISRTRPKMERIEQGTDEHGKPVYVDIPMLNDEGDPLKEIEWVDTPTLSGLALSIGCDRNTILNYSYEDEFISTIKRAKQKIEAYLEKRLDVRPQAVGTIFALKNNNGWKDAQTLDISHSQALPSYDVSRMTLEQKRVLIELIDLATDSGSDAIDVPYKQLE